MPPARLAVFIDGAPLPPEEGRAFWQRFSDHMEAHRGDLAGFAASEKLASVHPEVRGGEPVLVGSKTAVQRPYTNATERVSDRAPAKRRRS